MNPIERADLERARQKFKQLADELQRIAPAISMRSAALASECDTRIRSLEGRTF